MSILVVLERIELIPVLELEPFKFATQTRSSSALTDPDFPEEWYRYWSDSLADSHLGGLNPLRRGGWHVPVAEFDDLGTLRKYLEVVIRDWGGIESLTDPNEVLSLSGGLALNCPHCDVLVEPNCCGDLGDAANWRTAAGYRQIEWQMLWIGHPHLSVSYRAPWLILSDLHGSNNPEARWAVCPEELQRATKVAADELERFGRQVSQTLISQGYKGDSNALGRKLAGLDVAPDFDAIPEGFEDHVDGESDSRLL